MIYWPVSAEILLFEYTCVRDCYFARCGGSQDEASVVPCVVQRYNGLKFHVDTQEVGRHERGESCAMRELMASENL